jgi:hypothetical protein
MRPTIIAIRHLEIDNHVIAHGCEIMPGLLPKETVAKLLDQGRIQERPRRSLFRLLHHFAGCTETEPLDDELTSYSLRE